MATVIELKDDPAVQALGSVLSIVKNYAANLTIRSEDSYIAAGERLKVIKRALSDIEEARLRITKPLVEAQRETNAQAKSAAAPFLADESTIKRAMIEFANAQERLRREEQHRLNVAAQKEQERLRAIADAAAAKGQEAKAERFEERASQVVAPVAQAAAPKVGGISIPTVYAYEITDESLIPREYLAIDYTKIRKVVQALKMETRIAGVRVYEDKQLRAGKA